MIVDKIEEWILNSKTPVLEEHLLAFAEGCIRSIKKQLPRKPRNGRGELHASSAWYCARKMVYEMLGYEGEPHTANSLITFTEGDIFEQFGIMLTREALGARVLEPGLDGVQTKHVVEFGGHPVVGNVDMVISDGEGHRIPVDWKSTNGIGMDEAKGANEDPTHPWWEKQRFRYLTQLRTYIHAEQAPYGIFCYFNKEHGSMLELHVKPDPTWKAEMDKRAPYVMLHKESGSIPPPPPFHGVKTLTGANRRPDGSTGPVQEIEHFLCRYCDMKKHCYPGFDCVPLANGPKWRKAV